MGEERFIWEEVPERGWFWESGLAREINELERISEGFSITVDRGIFDVQVIEHAFGHHERGLVEDFSEAEDVPEGIHIILAFQEFLLVLGKLDFPDGPIELPNLFSGGGVQFALHVGIEIGNFVLDAFVIEVFGPIEFGNYLP